MSFENLTWCPIDKRLIKLSLLSDKERLWLNDYHKQTYEKISPFINDDKILLWLKDVTSPL